MNTPIDELLAGYVIGDLSPEEQNFCESYLKEHSEQLDEIRALQSTLSLIPFYLPEATPSPQLREHLVKGNFPRSVLPGIVACAIALAAIGSGVLGLQNYKLQLQVAAIQRTMEMPDNRLLNLKAMDATANSMGNLIISPSKSEGILVVQNLGTLTPDKKYTLWLVNNQGEKIFSQMFVPDRQGKVLIKVPMEGSMSSAQEAIITIEDATNTSNPKGPMILQGVSI